MSIPLNRFVDVHPLTRTNNSVAWISGPIENLNGLHKFRTTNPNNNNLELNIDDFETMIILHSDEETYPVDRCAPLFEVSATTEREEQSRIKKEFDSSSSHGGASTPRTTRVSFLDDVVTHEIPHFSTYTPSEKHRCWNNAEDFARIHVSNHKLVAKVLKGETIDQESETLRGLENLLRGSKTSRRHQEFVVIVLETQDELLYEEDYFEELTQTIFLLGGTISHESAMEAARVGQRDEEGAT